MNLNLTLYGTEGCHLCAHAQSILDQASLRWCDVDIAEDDTLLERYGTRIPVLLCHDNGKELNWPFNYEDVFRLIES
jgi:glutaredoxin